MTTNPPLIENYNLSDVIIDLQIALTHNKLQLEWEASGKYVKELEAYQAALDSFLGESEDFLAHADCLREVLRKGLN